MLPLHRPPRRLAVGLLLATLPACRITSPLALPPVAPTASWRPATTAAELSPRGLLVTVFAVAQPPAGTPLALAAAVISSDRGAPFRGRSRLPIGSLWLDDTATRVLLNELQQAPPQCAQPLGDAELFVTAGLCTTVEVPDSPLPRLELRPHGEAVEVQLVTPLAATAAATEDADAVGHEHLKIAALIAENTTAALFVPSSAAGAGGYLLALLPGPPPAPELVAAQATATQAPAPTNDTDTAPAGWRVAMQAIGEHNRRPALLALLGPRDVRRAADAVLAADERGLVAVTRSLAAIPAADREQPWALERAVWNGLLPRIERDDLTPPMRAALVRQLGALADDPSTLSLLLGSSADCAAFAAALREENVVALDDRSAAARTVATDWLRGIGVALPGYDPLADKATRRDALRSWHEAQAAAEEAGR